MINRCVCFNVLLSELKEIAEANNIKTVEELQEHIVFGFGCGMCLQYASKMLQTGKVEFDPKGN